MNETLKKIWDLSQSNDINEYLIVTQSMASGISYEVQTLLDEIERLQVENEKLHKQLSDWAVIMGVHGMGGVTITDNPLPAIESEG